MDKITVLLADDNEYMRFVIKEMLHAEDSIRIVGEAGDGKEVLETVKIIKPEIVVMDVNMPIINGIEATILINQLLPEINVILISINDERHHYKEAMQAGAKEYLIKPISPNQLITVIKNVATFNRKRLGSLKNIPQKNKDSLSNFNNYSTDMNTMKNVVNFNQNFIPVIKEDYESLKNINSQQEKKVSKSTFSANGIISAVKNIAGIGEKQGDVSKTNIYIASNEENEVNHSNNIISSIKENDFSEIEDQVEINNTNTPVEVSKVISVFGTKGGVGKSIICTNLAVALSQNRHKVGIVDLDIQFGDVSVIMNVNPKKTFSELILEDDINKELLEEYLYESNRIKILAAPNKPEFSELVTSEGVEQVIKLFKQMYDYVLIDTPSFIDEKTITALESSDLIILVVTLDLPTINNVKKSLDILKSLSLLSKTKLVLNRSSDANGISAREMEKVLELEIQGEIISDGNLVTTSLNRGVPFVKLNPKAEISKNIKNLTKILEN